MSFVDLDQTSVPEDFARSSVSERAHREWLLEAAIAKRFLRIKLGCIRGPMGLCEKYSRPIHGTVDIAHIDPVGGNPMPMLQRGFRCSTAVTSSHSRMGGGCAGATHHASAVPNVSRPRPCARPENAQDGAFSRQDGPDCPASQDYDRLEQIGRQIRENAILMIACAAKNHLSHILDSNHTDETGRTSFSPRNCGMAYVHRPSRTLVRSSRRFVRNTRISERPFSKIRKCWMPWRAASPRPWRRIGALVSLLTAPIFSRSLPQGPGVFYSQSALGRRYSLRWRKAR